MTNALQASRTEDEPDQSPAPKANPPAFQGSWFGNIPAAFIVSAVILYVAGWSYAYGYFSAFGLSLLDIGFDLHQTMMLATAGLPWWLYGLLTSALVLFISLQVVGRWKRPRRRVSREQPQQAPHEHPYLSSFAGRLLESMASLCIALLLLEKLSHDSIQRGRNDAGDEMTGGTHLPMARLMLDRDKLTGQLPANVSSDNSLEGFLLVHGRTGYYVFRPVAAHSKISNLPRSNLTVSFVPDQVVLAAEIRTPILGK